MTEEGLCLRPFKIWSADRTSKQTIVAGSLRELIERGKISLACNDDDITIVLEEDGTEVDEEDYFKMLPTNTVFLLLKSGEKWQPDLQVQKGRWRKGTAGAEDSTDLGAGGDDTQSQLQRLVSNLKQDTGRIFLLTEPELQLLADMVPEDYASDEDEVKFLTIVQEACDRYLIDHAEARDDLQFIRMCKKVTKK